MLKIPSLADRLKRDLCDASLKLHTFTEQQNMPTGELWEAIKELYASERWIDNGIACILNGVESSRKKQFLLSQRTLVEYFKADKNLRRNSINGNENKRLMNELLAVSGDAQILTCIISPKKGTGNERNSAGTYEISHPEIRKLMPWLGDSTQGSSQVATQASTVVSTQEASRGLEWNGMERSEEESYQRLLEQAPNSRAFNEALKVTFGKESIWHVKPENRKAITAYMLWQGKHTLPVKFKEWLREDIESLARQDLIKKFREFFENQQSIT